MENALFELPRQTFEEMRGRTGAAPVETEFTFDDPSVRVGTDDFCITAENGKIRFSSKGIRGVS